MPLPVPLPRALCSIKYQFGLMGFVQFKTVLRFPVDYRKAKRLLESKTEGISGRCRRPIVLDLYTFDLLVDCGRHLVAFADAAEKAGSPLLFRCSPLVLSAMARKIHGREFLSHRNAILLHHGDRVPTDSLVITDQPATDKINAVQLRIGRDIEPEFPTMPYSMHPAIAPLATDDHLEICRRRERGTCIMFAGNMNPKYGRPSMGRDFGLCSRETLVMLLTDVRDKHAAHNDPGHNNPEHNDALDIESGLRAIDVIDSRQDPIASADWLSTVAGSRFFVCCPGVCQPMCHNLVESMAVGTIPILEYADRVVPVLEDGETAICFQGQDGFRQALNRALQMPTDEVEAMSKRVAEFYDRSLRQADFLASIRDAPRSCSAISFPYHNENLYQRSLGQSVA